MCYITNRKGFYVVVHNILYQIWRWMVAKVRMMGVFSIRVSLSQNLYATSVSLSERAQALSEAHTFLSNQWWGEWLMVTIALIFLPFLQTL